MARPLRIERVGERHHVVARGNERRPIVRDGHAARVAAASPHSPIPFVKIKDVMRSPVRIALVILAIGLGPVFVLCAFGHLTQFLAKLNQSTHNEVGAPEVIGAMLASMAVLSVGFWILCQMTSGILKVLNNWVSRRAPGQLPSKVGPLPSPQAATMGEQQQEGRDPIQSSAQVAPSPATSRAAKSVFLIGGIRRSFRWFRAWLARRSQRRRALRFASQRFKPTRQVASWLASPPELASSTTFAGGNAISTHAGRSAPKRSVSRQIPAKTKPQKADTITVHTKEESRDDFHIETLIGKLRSEHRTEERRTAAEYLGLMGSAARMAIPALMVACVDIDATVRAAAMDALKAIDSEWQQHPDGEAAIPSIIAALRNRSTQVVDASSRVLGIIGPSAIPGLIDALSRPEDTIEKVYVMQLLGRNGPRAADAVPGLTKALASQHVQARVAAGEALGGIGPASASAVPPLMEGIKDEFPDVRRAMARALAGIGQAAQPAAPALLHLLADRIEGVREAAGDALEKIGPQTVPMLIEIVQTRRIHRYEASVEAMNEIRKAYTKAPVDGVVWDQGRVLRNLDWTRYEASMLEMTVESAVDLALRLLGRFGSRASNAVIAVTQVLEDPNSIHRLTAIRTLGHIGSDARGSLPQLAAFLDHRDQVFREAASQALRRIDGD